MGVCITCGSHLHVLVPLVQEVHALHVIGRCRSRGGLKPQFNTTHNAPQHASTAAAAMSAAAAVRITLESTILRLIYDFFTCNLYARRKRTKQNKRKTSNVAG